MNDIDELINNIELTYLNYLNKPTWEKIQILFQYFFKLGVEVGKIQMKRNIEMMEDDEVDHDKYVSVGCRQQKESESSKMINNLHPGENILEFNDSKIARKKFNSLQKFAKYKGIPLMMKQQGNLLYIKKE